MKVAELQELLSQYSDDRVSGKARIVRNGYLPERTIQTGPGNISVKVPKVLTEKAFILKLPGPTLFVEEFIPWLYLRGISTGDMQPTLEVLPGKGAKGLSANTV